MSSDDSSLSVVSPAIAIVSLREFQRLLRARGVTRNYVTLMRAVEDGLIQAQRDNKRWRIPVSELDAYAAFVARCPRQSRRRRRNGE